MSKLTQAIWVEALKARRSRMPWLTGLAFALLPLAGAFFMIILKDPEMARRVGLISTKAHLVAGAADWPTYLTFLAEAIAGGGMALFAIIGSWVFGREFADRTAKDLLALPTPRSAIVAAKFVVVGAWSLALTVMIGVIGLAVGAAIGLAGGSLPVVMQGASVIAAATGLTIVLIAPVAFFAGAGHGYLPPMGFVLLMLLFAQVVAAAGWGEYFPWSIPIVFSEGGDIGAVSYLIVILTGLAGLAATFGWWQWADQTR